MQLGTHLDALCHLRMGDEGYDGFTLADSTPSGVSRLGIETVPQIVTRGWLVDVAPRVRGDVITIKDVAGIDVEPGDGGHDRLEVGDAEAPDAGQERPQHPATGAAYAIIARGHRVASRAVAGAA